LLLALTLLATLGASVWTHRRQQEADDGAAVAAAVPRSAQQDAPAAAPEAPAVPAAQRDAAGRPVVDLFSPVSWDTPPPPPSQPPAPPPPAPPQAPPLPFEFFGRTEVVGEAGPALIHLRRGKEVLSVREGERIDGQYRLDKVGSDALEIVYLPMDTKQILVIGPR
jgi:hypothetical protein